MKHLILILLVISITLCLAQDDSTFVRYYYPIYETHPFWQSFPISQIYAGNVFEKYDGNFGMQILSTFHTPPPEWICPQSPIANYTRGGVYLDTTFGPYTNQSLIPGYYSHVIKDGLGGYLALDMFERWIHRLDNNLQFVELVQLVNDNETFYSVRDLIIDDNGFIVVSGLPDYKVSKFNFDLTCLWSTPLPANQHQRFRKLNDGSYIILWRYNPYFRVMKVSSMGDSIWVKQIQCEVADDFIDINNNFYGFIHDSIDINTAELRIYDFGIDFENEDPGAPILVIPTYPFLDNNEYGLGEPFSVIRTSDNCIIVAVSTPTGEIFKFDNNFNLIWSSNALSIEEVGIGNHPLIELGNGDILYCATVTELPRRLGLVRIDSDGNYVGIDDDTEQTPANTVIFAYPNPFKNELNLEFKTISNANNLLEFYNIKGQLIESKTLQGTKTTWIPHNLPSGVYIMKFIGGSKLIESKMITYIK